ncbi:hypothetical protein BJX76DRAFT_354288 [Aspergillus varians]
MTATTTRRTICINLGFSNMKMISCPCGNLNTQIISWSSRKLKASVLNIWHRETTKPLETGATIPSLPPPDDDVIKLEVGERTFTTTRDTLVKESTFFSALLSSRWNSARADGSYLVDAYPNLVQHILGYLRRSTFPLFYHSLKGHDYPLYSALLEEAKYFGIDRLAE